MYTKSGRDIRNKSKQGCYGNEHPILFKEKENKKRRVKKKRKKKRKAGMKGQWSDKIVPRSRAVRRQKNQAKRI